MSEKRPRRSAAELPILGLLAVVLAIGIKSLVAQAFFIPSASMMPQLQIHDRVVVSKLAYRLHPPRRGDIVVFTAPPAEQLAHHNSHNPVVRVIRGAGEAIGMVQVNTELIKRVIGLPGETVEGRNGQVFIDGARLVEPYLAVGTVTGSFGPVTVPHGNLWVMGDNRPNSADSRTFGPIGIPSVVGRTIWRIWPVDHLSFL